MRKKMKFDIQRFAMRNADLQESTEAELQEQIRNAIESGDSEEFAKVQVELARTIEARILQEARQAVNEDLNDQAVMVNRGLNPLTAEERTYYNEVIAGEGFAGTERLVPATVFERVFEELRLSRPLLNEINFVNTTATTEWITRSEDAESAWWGPLVGEIKRKLESAFKVEKTELFKLSAFVPVAKAMLDLGPQWLDRFVRELLFESLAIALELAIVKGTGKEQPIGMMMDLKGNVVDGVYPQKEAIAINDLKPATLGKEIMAPLTKEGKRVVPSVLLVVNPTTYWEKIFPQTTYLTADKTYVYGVLPIPAKIVQSVAVPKGKMVAGISRRYFMGVGSSQKMEYSDQYQFLEDVRIYLSKQYANGKPLDNDSFMVFDVSNMQVEIPEV